MPSSSQGLTSGSSCWARGDSPGRTEVLAAIYANTWGSLFLTQETTKSRVIQSCVGCLCVCAAASTGSASLPPQDRVGKVWRAQKGSNPPESQSLFPQALAKIQRHRFAFIHRCGGDHGGFQSWTTTIPFCLFTTSTGCSEKCLCAGLVRGSLNYSRSS